MAPCWETNLHGTVTQFIHIVSRLTNYVFVLDYLLKDICIVKSLETYSVSL